jgi:hypothetical protein
MSEKKLAALMSGQSIWFSRLRWLGRHATTETDIRYLHQSEAAWSGEDLTLVTRNVSDFDALGIRLFNPWCNG